MNHRNVQELLEFLASKTPGPISELGEIGRILSQCWDQFTGGDAEGMAAYKLLGRIEGACWHPPILSFIIERHGGVVLGSTRAELQQWNVDVDKLRLTCQPTGTRQLGRQPKLDVRPMAEEIVRLIVDRQEDERLKWNDDGSVRVFISKILPDQSAPKETLAGRRKRFRKVLDDLLSDSGWQKVRIYVYAPPAA